jgi:hypothetical protein
MMISSIMLFIAGTDARKIAPLYRLPDPVKVSLIATAFEHTPPDTHDDLARAFSDATLHVELADALAAIPGMATPETTERYRQALGGRPFRIEAFGGRAPASFEARPLISVNAVRFQWPCRDGHAVTVEQMVIAPVAKIVDNLLLFLRHCRRRCVGRSLAGLRRSSSERSGAPSRGPA